MTFIDDCTRYCYVYLLRSKDKALKKFMHYKNVVENQLGRKIKVIRSDRGGEYDAPFESVLSRTWDYSPNFCALYTSVKWNC